MTEREFTSTRDEGVVSQLDDLVRRFGGDPERFSGRLVREMIQNALRMLRDGADTGELKLASRSFRELRYALKVFRAHRHEKKCSIFGSARTPAEHADYRAAVEASRLLSERGWMVITGAGGGIMKAGHEGAGRARSFGVSIRLPFETNANEFIEGDPKLVTFRYFFTRKLIFVSQADALLLLPGGFGTLDEAFEVLTLVQTGKTDTIPIVMLEPPGSSYWENFDRYVKGDLLGRGLIGADDLHLYHIFHGAGEAVDHLIGFYGNYHSQRFVEDRLVIRVQRALGAMQVEALNGEFGDLVAEGQIEQSGRVEGEQEGEHPELSRLSFVFVKRSYGRLRLLIDRINEYGKV